jgi:hypothetical protein
VRGSGQSDDRPIPSRDANDFVVRDFALRLLCMTSDITNQTILDHLQTYVVTKNEAEHFATKDELRAAKDEILHALARIEEVVKSIERQVGDIKYKVERS